MALTEKEDPGKVPAKDEDRYNRLLFKMGDHDPITMKEASDELINSVLCQVTQAEALSSLIKSIKDPYHLIRTNAINILGTVANNVDISMAYPAFAHALSDCCAATRINSSIALLNAAQFSKHDLSPYIPDFGRALKDPEPYVRINCAWAIGYLAGKKSGISSLYPDLSSIIPSLIEALDDPEPDVRYYSATALGAAANHGADISSAFQALFQHLDDPHDNTAITARWALERASVRGKPVDIEDARVLLAKCVDQAIARNGESAGIKARKIAALMYSKYSETARKSKAAMFDDTETFDRMFKAPFCIRSPGGAKNKLFRAPLSRI